MSSKASLLKQQLDWAHSASLKPDHRGYLENYELNLQQKLSPSAREAFQNGSGTELLPTERRPAKMAALHSSSALAVNAFDYWSDKPLNAVADALGLERVPSRFQFEAQFSTGLGGIPPNLDLAFYYSNNDVLGVESKFSEWISKKKPAAEHFKPKYFPETNPLWLRSGLHGAQSLAYAIHTGELRFQHLDAAQLLKHILGLATSAPGPVSLYYIYYDLPGQESSIHHTEIERFSELVGSDVNFRSISYQAFLGKLGRSLKGDHRAYLDYMGRRYCGAAV